MFVADQSAEFVDVIVEMVVPVNKGLLCGGTVAHYGIFCTVCVCVCVCVYVWNNSDSRIFISQVSQSRCLILGDWFKVIDSLRFYVAEICCCVDGSGGMADVGPHVQLLPNFDWFHGSKRML